MRLFKPDSFRDDWYGWLTNQLSHTLLGIVAASVVCCVFFLVAGEYPYRIHVWILITVVYVSRETWRRGVRWDSLEDTVFVCGYGAGSTLHAFQEVSPGLSMVTLSPLSLLAPATLLTVHCLVGSAVRWSR